MNAIHQNTHPLLRPGGLGLSLINQGLTDQIAIEEAIEIAQSNGRDWRRIGRTRYYAR